MKPLAMILLAGVVSLPGVTEAADLLCRTPLEISVKTISASGTTIREGVGATAGQIVEAFFQTPAKAGKKGVLLNQGECAFETSASDTNRRVIVDLRDPPPPDLPKSGPFDSSRLQVALGAIMGGVGQCAQTGRWLVKNHARVGTLVDPLLERDLLVRFADREMRLTRWNAATIPGESDSTKEKSDFESILRQPTTPPTAIPGTSDRTTDGTKGTDVFIFKQPTAATPR